MAARKTVSAPPCLRAADNAMISPSDYLSEEAILARWPTLSRAELRRARKSNPPKIAFYDFPRRSGGPCCTPAQVQEYIDRTYLRMPECPGAISSDSRSATTTLIAPIPIAEAPGMLAGMTPELARHAAEATGIKGEIAVTETCVSAALRRWARLSTAVIFALDRCAARSGSGAYASSCSASGASRSSKT